MKPLRLQLLKGGKDESNISAGGRFGAEHLCGGPKRGKTPE